MIVVSVFLIALPLAYDPVPSLIAFAIILSGAPVYVFLVMERPWKLRPAFLDTCSGEEQNCVYNIQQLLIIPINYLPSLSRFCYKAQQQALAG